MPAIKLILRTIIYRINHTRSYSWMNLQCVRDRLNYPVYTHFTNYVQHAKGTKLCILHVTFDINIRVFEVLVEQTMNTAVFWDVMQYRKIKI
jgi:hypothetical protein